MDIMLETYKNMFRLSQQIARKFRDPNAQIQCCDTDGCNWTWSTAVNNQAAGSSSSDLTIASVDYAYVGKV